MPYILNTTEANFQHPDIGTLPPKTAVEIAPDIVDQFRFNRSVLVFDSVIGMVEVAKPVRIPPKHESLGKRYQDFVSEYKDLKLASVAWEEYKKAQEVEGVSNG
jgi:hypothetical protein